MTTCRSLTMSAGAMSLTDLRTTIPGASLKDSLADQEAGRIRAAVDERLLAGLDVERRKLKDRCGTCGRQLEGCIQELKREIEQQVLEMGLKLAEIVLRHKLPYREMLASLIRDTLGPVSDLQGVRVRVSLAEAESLRTSGSCGLPHTVVSEQVVVVADAALSDGDLIIESRNGIFDGRLNERLSLLKDKLSERMKQTDADPAKTS
ncbi:MAG: FliH/SctL family protein [bacterium]